MYAADGNNLELIEWLLDDMKVDPNAERRGHTALAFALTQGNAQAMRLLLDRGARGSFPENLCPLVLACRVASLECVELLLELGFTFEKLTPVEAAVSIKLALDGQLISFCQFVFGQLRAIDLSLLSSQGLFSLRSVGLLCSALRTNATVEHVNLSGLVSDQALPALIALVSSNRHIISLVLGQCGSKPFLSISGMERLLACAVQSNRSLLQLDFGTTDVGSLDIASMAEDSSSGGQQLEDEEGTEAEAESGGGGVKSGGGGGGHDEANIKHRIGLLNEAIYGTVTRNKHYRWQLMRAAIHTLCAARLLLQPAPITQIAADSPLACLPAELLEAVVVAADGDGVMCPEERQRVLAFALNLRQTVGTTRQQFLRMCLVSLTCWPEGHNSINQEKGDGSNVGDKEEADGMHDDDGGGDDNDGSGAGGGGSSSWRCWQDLLNNFKSYF